MKVNWTLQDGKKIQAEVADGINMMEAAVANLVTGVIGECGGSMSCATCHVFVHPDWAGKVGGPEDFEDAMLDVTEAERNETSRLSCQILASLDLDGLELTVPPI